MGAGKGIIFIRPEYESAARILEREIGVAREAGFSGHRTSWAAISTSTLDVHRSGGRYICGEVTAQINAIEGQRPNPKQPPPYPTEKGLWDRPTLVQNVETLCLRPAHPENGPEWFKDLALTETGAGTKTLRHQRQGQPARLLRTAHGGPAERDHRGARRRHAARAPEFKACLPGGASTRFLPRAFYDIEMDFEALQAGRAPPGHRGHHGVRPQHLHGGRHPEPHRIFRPGILRVVHAVPGGAPLHPGPAAAHRERRGRGEHSCPCSSACAGICESCLLRLCAGRGGPAGGAPDAISKTRCGSTSTRSSVPFGRQTAGRHWTNGNAMTHETIAMPKLIIDDRTVEVARGPR